jgi:hypothetical protein
MQLPMILILLVANVLWYIVGWSQGFNEGKREGLALAKKYQRAAANAS